MTRPVFTLLLFTGFFAMAGCKKNDPKEVENATSRIKIPPEVSTGVEIIYSDSAIVKAKLNAAKMIRRSEPKETIEMPEGLKVEFFDRDKKINSSLRANKGIRYLDKNITKVFGDVVVINIKGDTLNTEVLYWNEAQETIYSDKFVKVTTEDEIILAEGFESDVNFTNYKFFKITGVVSVKE